MSNTTTVVSSKTSRGAAGHTTPISVVVPCFNEAEGIRHLAESLERFDEDMGSRYDVQYIFVDDGSTDETHDRLVEAFSDDVRSTVVSHSRNLGVSAAIMTGLRYAQRDIVCSIDSDCTYDPRQLLELIPHLADDVDIVTASPYHPAGSVLGVPGWRLVLSRVASIIYRTTLATDLFCYTSCFRVYRRASIAPLKVSNSGFVGIAELIWRCEINGRKVVEAPAVLRTRKFGVSKMNVVRTTATHLKLLSRIVLSRFVPSMRPTTIANRTKPALAE